MRITHNGEETSVDDDKSVADFLHDLNYRKVVVKINGKMISSGHYGQTMLKEGDDVFIKRISAGG